MTYSYVNGNKENPKYVFDTCGGNDIRTLTENLQKLVYPETVFTVVGVDESGGEIVHGQLVFNGKEKKNDFSLSYRREGSKVIIDKFEVQDL